MNPSFKIICILTNSVYKIQSQYYLGSLFHSEDTTGVTPLKPVGLGCPHSQMVGQLEVISIFEGSERRMSDKHIHKYYYIIITKNVPYK